MLLHKEWTEELKLLLMGNRDSCGAKSTTRVETVVRQVHREILDGTG